MTPQQSKTLKLLAVWSVFAFLMLVGLLWIELNAVSQGGNSTISELMWKLWAEQPWVVFIVSHVIAAPFWFLQGHFWGQRSGTYVDARNGVFVIFFAVLPAFAVSLSACRSLPNVVINIPTPPPPTIDVPVFPSPAPDASPMPSPAPSASASPTPASSPSPSPASSPTPAECRTPQLENSSWQLLNDSRGPADLPAANAFVAQLVSTGVQEALLETIEEQAHCKRDNPCPVGSGNGDVSAFQAFIAETARRMRARGYCAGQFEDGVQDGIALSIADEQGTWAAIHEVAYTGSVNWNKVEGDYSIFRRVGDSPLPSPAPIASPSPSPAPAPEPTNGPNNVASVSIRASASSVKAGGSVTFTCAGKTYAGAPARPPDLFNEAVPKGGNLVGANFTVDRAPGSYSETVHIKPDAPAGALEVDCDWYGEKWNPTGHRWDDIGTENLRVAVTR